MMNNLNTVSSISVLCGLGVFRRREWGRDSEGGGVWVLFGGSRGLINPCGFVLGCAANILSGVSYNNVPFPSALAMMAGGSFEVIVV